MLQDPCVCEFKNNRIPSLSFRVSLSSSFSFTSTTLHRQRCSQNSNQNSLNSWLLQTIPGLPDSSLDVEFEALCAKRKLPLLFFIIPHRNVKTMFSGCSNQRLNYKKVFNYELTMKCESAFRRSCSHLHINTILKRKV